MTCPSTSFICISHLLYDTDLFLKKAGAFTGKSGSRSGHGEILTRAASANDVHGRQLGSVELRDVPHMDHVGEVVFCDLDGEGFDLAGPDGGDPIPDSGQRKASDAIEEAAHGQLSHLDTAAAIVLVVLMAVWAV